MNREERTHLRKQTQAFDNTVREAVFSFSAIIDDFRNDEQDKLDRLPEQIRESAKGDQITDAIQTLDDIVIKIQDLENTLDDILDLVDASSLFDSSIARRKCDKGQKKDKNFHALLSSSMLYALKGEASRSGLSMNEILCRALLNELDREDR